MNDLTVKAARLGDIGSIMAVLDAAKKIMRSSGNSGQWVNGYPGEDIIRSDISSGYGKVVLDGGRISGYFAFIPSPEPTYREIFDGRWLDDLRTYHVVHRIGSLPDVHGVFRTIMDWCFTQDSNIRVDTHRDNTIMQHVLEAYGFEYCGVIFLLSGDERLAYQKVSL